MTTTNTNPETTMSKAMRDLEEYTMTIRTELDKAPSWKVGTRWWTDRIRELQACLRRLELARK